MSRNIQTLRVPCSLLSVDSPKRREFLQEGVPKQLNENILGHGSYGTVIKAIYKDKPVAVKIIDKSNNSKMSTIASESNIVGWHHENIIEILKIDSGPRQAVVIMERFPGQCLQHILERMTLPQFHLISICADIANGLAYCHERLLLHLDIKPKNILVAVLKTEKTIKKSYQCKLCDFGSSTFLSEYSTKVKVRGTIRYMAPELLKNEEASTKVDIYSLGITMWQMKSGIDPYFWITDNEVVAYKVVKENIRPDFKPVPSKEGYLSSSFENNCLCRHLCSVSDLPDPLIQNTNPILFSEKRYSSSSPAKIPGKVNRLPFSNLNKQLNSRDKSPKKPNFNLIDKTVFSKENVVIQINSTPLDGHESIENVFRKGATHNRKWIDSEYEKLCKCCWSINPIVRPETTIILKTLNHLLDYFESGFN